MLLQTAQCGLIQISSKLLVTCLLIGPLILILIKFLVLWRLSNQNWKPPVLRRNRTKPKPQFSGGYVMVFLKFQKWPSLITKVRNDNVITGHAMTPAATVWSNCLTVWSGVALQINYWPQWTHVTLRAPTELTDWPLAPESYVITHHVISHYYVASDCWSTDSSEKCKQLYVTWAYSEAYTYMWFSSCRTQHTQRNRCTACDAMKKPKYAMHWTDFILECVAFFVCMQCIRCSFMICFAWSACVASVALPTAAWKPTFMSIYIGLHVVSKLPYATHTNAKETQLSTQSTNQNYTMHAREKHNACNRFYSLHALHFSMFLLCACIAYVALRTTARNRPSPFSVGGDSVSMFGTCRPTSTGNR